MNKTEKRDIAKLTDRIPLALDLIGSLLSRKYAPPTPAEIIAKLNEDPFNSTLGRMRQSINISYSYLDEKLQEVGRYLAHFPGSFDKSTVVSILLNIYSYKTLEDGAVYRSAVDELVTRSLLVYDTHSERYHFHGLIKKFLSLPGNSSKKQQFDVAFQGYFASVLCKKAEEFIENPKHALLVLDLERHNFKFFMAILQNPTHPSYEKATNCFEHAFIM